jgi:sulfur-oxidizing protein SoxX
MRSLASPTAAKGDAARTRDRDQPAGLASLLRTSPVPRGEAAGHDGADLKAPAAFNEGQLRLRIVDAARLNPNSIMPAYYRIDGLTRVAPLFQGKPILTAEQIEDVVAYLTTLRE